MNKTIPDLFFETANKFSTKTALLYKKNEVYFSVNFNELVKKVRYCASGFQKIGVKKGDKVAILSENRPEWTISDLGIMLIGAVVVPLHTTLSSKALCNVLNHSEAEVIIISNNNLLNKILLIQGELTFLRKIIFLEGLNHEGKKTFKKEILSWDRLLEEGTKKRLDPISIDPEEVCSIIYTSGTTGVPKGVMLTHRNFLSNFEAVTQAIPIYSNDIFLSFLPLSHVLERLAGYYVSLLSGATIAYAEGIKQLPVNLKEVKPTILISVPRIFEKFDDAIWDKVRASSKIKRKIFLWALKQKRDGLRHKIADLFVFKQIRKQLGGRLRFAVSGGASLNKKIAHFFLKIGVKILEGYGLTETSPVVTVNCEKDFKFSTVGKPISNVKIKISPEKEILVQGPNVTKGYFKNLEETKKVFDNNGWFYTGDLGFIDKEGFLTVVGRKKEMIVTSYGKNVWPEQIENELNKDRFIVNSMVVGHNRKFISVLIVPDWEEIGIFLKENNLLALEPEKLIKDHQIIKVFQGRIDKTNQNFCDFEKIKKFKLLVNEFSPEREELTPTLKLRRHIIEKHYQKDIEEMYSS